MSDGITDAIRQRPIVETKSNKHRWVRARCFPTPHDDEAKELAEESQLIELTVLGPQSGFPAGGRWRLRTETQQDGSWETPISEATAKVLMNEAGWNIPPLSR